MRKSIPGVLWISIVVLSIMVLVHLAMGLHKGNAALLIAGVAEIALVLGLAFGQKWAYIIIIVSALLGVGASLAKSAGLGLGTLVCNAIVVVPMLMSTRFFFPPQTTDEQHAS